MQKFIHYLYFVVVGLAACQSSPKDRSIVVAFDVYCEMVANDAKPMSLHYPMEKTALDKWWKEFVLVAKRYPVQLYRETDFPVTPLFPAKLTKGKTVVLIYKGKRLEQYQQLKADLKRYKGNDPIAMEAFARRLGRLLGYSPQGVNMLLSKNTDYRNLALLGVTQQVTHLYYEDVAEALQFYIHTLGLTKVDSAKFWISADAAIELHPLNKHHPKGQAKSTAVAFLTDQLPGWYAHLQANKVPIKYTYKPQKGGAHDGFVAIDPGGYLLEFEQFKQHPENELLMAVLAQAPHKTTAINQLNFYGAITWTYHQDLLKMQCFYEEILGYRLVADQGWTKIYQTSPTGFIGLVDEQRGMEDYADTKAVEIAWTVKNNAGFEAYAQQRLLSYQYQNNAFKGPEKYVYKLGYAK
ncbi:VOC family protein [uncultured Microscilla sp.]|uniref:VOC family protein n=1 Tax=uncultured Microscilla sp. TaxID=432653 RepID=UPI002606A17F|nr:VOC family protein [uncultured Microscilla sp.]